MYDSYFSFCCENDFLKGFGLFKPTLAFKRKGRCAGQDQGSAFKELYDLCEKYRIAIEKEISIYLGYLDNDLTWYKETVPVLGEKRVKRNIYNKIAEIYEMLNNRTVGDSRYIEVLEYEADNVLAEYLSHMCAKNNLTAIVYLGRQASVYAKGKITEVLKNTTAIYTFPAAFETSKIFIFLSFLDDSYSELYDVDFAMNMLKYYD